MKRTFLLLSGAWMGKWIWNDLKKNLEKLNHVVYAITLSGLESKNTSKDFGFQDHVADVRNFIETHSLSDLILVGHSYSGFIIGQVADQMPEKISKLIFIEAFLPVDGQNMIQGAGLDRKEENQAIEENNGKWPPPTLSELQRQSYMTEKQTEYLSKRLIDHPARNIQEKTSIKSEKISIPSTFVGAKLNLSDEQKSLYGKVDFRELNGGHWPMLSELEKLTKIVDEIATAE